MAKGFGRKEPKAFTKRQKAYLKLIYSLLTCRSDQARQILMKKQHLIDDGLLATMTIAAMVLRERGDRESAKFLINMVTHLYEAIAQESAQRSGSVRPVDRLTNYKPEGDREVADFIFQLLWQMLESDETEVYRLLEANLDKLDDRFIRQLRSIGKYIQSQIKPEKMAEVFHQLFKPNVSSTLEPEFRPTELMMMAGMMPVFNDMMLNFPKGNRATNIEIGIAGYEAIIPVFTAVPEQWASCQNSLAIAYKRRIYSDRRSNIEKAIASYRNALQVFTPELSPAIWADLQNNLASAYSERLEGDRLEFI